MLQSPRKTFLSLCVSLLLGLTACGTSTKGLSFSPTAQTQLQTYPMLGDTGPIQDPSTIRQGSAYYSFSTDVGGYNSGYTLPIRCSSDQKTWRVCGGVFSAIPAWVRSKIPNVPGLWAPDISYFNGIYHVYYAGSTLGSFTSVIGLATNTTLDPADPAYKWVDHGQVIASTATDDFNAIDPNIFLDTGGSVWMTYGSYASGIKQMQIDPATGMILAGARRYDLATRPDSPDNAIEGASLVRHGSYYYLFVSVDHCCTPSIQTDDYKQAMGRATSPHGPFVDEEGTPMMQGGGTVLLESNGTWNAPGGGTVTVDPETGAAELSFHVRNMTQNGQLYLWVKGIHWQNDWPVLIPLS